MSILSSPGIAELEAEADWVCGLVALHAEQLRAGTLERPFRLGDASFHLFAKDRNTIYRVSGRFDWFLKLPRGGDPKPMERERFGAIAINQALGTCPQYSGARVVRTGTVPSYVLAAAVPGQPLNRALARGIWHPGDSASARLERAFGTLGTLLATLHANASVSTDAPEATKRPFQALKDAVGAVRSPDAVTDAVAAWYEKRQRPDRGSGFVHGNMRLDNVLLADSRLGFVDLEHSGKGSFYQDLSRPVVQLLLTRASIAFPHRRAARYLRTYLSEYSRVQAYRPEELNDYVTARVGRYYLESRKGSMLSNRVGGLPVVTSKLRRLMTTLLENGMDATVPGRGL